MYLSRLLLGLSSITGTALAANNSPDVSDALQSILDKAYQAPLYTYPTSLTQGIIPKGIHSHNDYWRPLPLYTALSAGCISIEADVWLINSTLYVGHEISALSPSRTLQSLYIQPLLSILQAQNPSTSFVSSSATHNGVYDTASTQTLYLFIDLKTSGSDTWPAVIQALSPLRDGGWLTRVSAASNGSNVVTPGAITVIGTGNTPLNQVQGVVPRDYFFDGPLAQLDSTYSNITADVSPIASTDFVPVFGDVRNATGFGEEQLEALRRQVATAHGKGIMVRYWDTPGYPVGTRNAVWRQLWDGGADLINADDVLAAAGYGGEQGYW